MTECQYSALLIERKKDIRKELLNKRDEQVKSVQETEEIRQAREMSYKTYIENMQKPVLEYWDLDDHTPDRCFANRGSRRL